MRTLKNSRALCATVALTATVALGAAPAQAAPDDSQFSVEGGALALTTAPNVPPLPALTLSGSAQTLNATMSNWQVKDATGSASGWNLTSQGEGTALKSAVFKEYCTDALLTCATDVGGIAGPGYVTSSPKALAASSLNLTSTNAAFTAVGGATGTAPSHSCSSACALDSAGAVKIGSAAANAGMGEYQANSYSANSLALSAPTTVKALASNKVYRVDLTWTLNSGP